MQLYFFARFHAQKGKELEAEKELLDVLPPSREEPGCISIHAFRSLRDARLFYIHSVWKDEEAFEIHASQPHTVRFLDRMEPLIDHPLDTARTERIG